MMTEGYCIAWVCTSVVGLGDGGASERGQGAHGEWSAAREHRGCRRTSAPHENSGVRSGKRRRSVVRGQYHVTQRQKRKVMTHVVIDEPIHFQSLSDSLSV